MTIFGWCGFLSHQGSKLISSEAIQTQNIWAANNRNSTKKNTLISSYWMSISENLHFCASFTKEVMNPPIELGLPSPDAPWACCVLLRTTNLFKLGQTLRNPSTQQQNLSLSSVVDSSSNNTTFSRREVYCENNTAWSIVAFVTS